MQQLIIGLIATGTFWLCAGIYTITSDKRKARKAKLNLSQSDVNPKETSANLETIGYAGRW